MIYVAYETQHSAKPLRIVFDKIDGCIREYDGTKYLALFHSNEKYERIADRIRYLIMINSNISDVDSHKYMKIKINSGGNLPLEKTLDIQNLVIIIKSSFNKNHNPYYYNLFILPVTYFDFMQYDQKVGQYHFTSIDIVITESDF